METNLAYAGGGTNTYGDAMPAITQGSTSADFIYTEARYYIPPGSNRTTGTTDPSTSTNGGATNPQYGYLYNWCATMGRQSAACQGSAATQPNPSKNPGNGTIYNICPANWRLPSSVDGGDFQNLNTVINNGSTSGDSGLLANGLYMYSGGWDGNSFTALGPSGYYWSSTANPSNVNTAYLLGFNNTLANHAGYVNKRYGFAIRCVAE